MKAVADMLGRLADALDTESPRLLAFVRAAWPIVEPGTPFLEAWFHAYLAEHLEAVSCGQITRLAIYMPPRYGKSTFVSVCWPAWEWATVDPTMRYICASYAASLALDHSVDRRDVIKSEWFRQRWGSKVQLADDQNQKAEFQNTMKGTMVATSVGGTLTGKGGNRLIGDDIMDPKRAESKSYREAALAWYSRTFSTRLDDKKHGAIVNVQQRLHSQDVHGAKIQKEGGWVVIDLPAETDKSIKYSYPRSGQEMIRNPGDVLWPEREGKSELDRQAVAMGDAAYQAQYNQKPSSEIGRKFKRIWWQELSEVPVGFLRGWAWDGAVKQKQESDYSVGVLITAWQKGYFIERVVRSRMEFPELRRTARQVYQQDPGSFIVVEDKSSGQQLVQELANPSEDGQSPLPVVPADSKFSALDKVTRASLVQPLFEAGKVYVKKDAVWVPDLFSEFAEFPGGEHDDQVDAVVHGLWYMKSLLEQPGAESEEFEESREAVDAI